MRCTTALLLGLSALLLLLSFLPSTAASHTLHRGNDITGGAEAERERERNEGLERLHNPSTEFLPSDQLYSFAPLAVSTTPSASVVPFAFSLDTSFLSSPSDLSSTASPPTSESGCTSQKDQDIIFGRAFASSSASSSSSSSSASPSSSSTFSPSSSTTPHPSSPFFSSLFVCGKRSMGNTGRVKMCLQTTLLGSFGLRLSESCAKCYAVSAHCGAEHCMGQCLVNQCDQLCLQCGIRNCQSGLQTCVQLQQLPEPCVDTSSEAPAWRELQKEPKRMGPLV